MGENQFDFALLRVFHFLLSRDSATVIARAEMDDYLRAMQVKIPVFES